MMSLRWTPPLLLLFLLIISGVVSQQWDVSYSPSSICALKGSTVTMGCTYTYPTNYTVQTVFWSRELVRGKEPPDLSLDPKYRNRVRYLGDRRSDCNLRLSDVTEQDRGKYYFRFLTASAGGRHQGRDGVDLSVTELQVEIPDRVLEGDTVTLTCKTSNRLQSGNLTFIWYKSGHRLSSSSNLLRLPSVSQRDSGDYSCAVQTFQTFQSCNVTLNVQYPPKSVSVSIRPSGEIVEGSSVTLTCSSDANPPVEFNWYKGTVFKSKGKTSVIRKISSEDSGDYKCKSSNQYGEKQSKAVTLNVLYPPKRVTVSISPSGEIMEGGSVNLTCSSDANPPVQSYTWYKVNESSPVGSGQSYSFTLSSSSSGWFYCAAQNKYGTQSAAAVPLTLDGSRSVVLYVVIGVSVGCGCLFAIIGVLCLRRKRRGGSADDARSSQTVHPNPPDDTYTALDLQTRSSNDVYHTLTKVSSSPPDDTYTAVDLQTRSSNDVHHTHAMVHPSTPDDTYTALDSESVSGDYYNLPVRRGQF